MSNTYWLNSRHLMRVVAETNESVFATSYPSLTRERISALGRIIAIPTWIILAMILLAVSATSVTVILRTHGELRTSSQQYREVAAEMELLRRENVQLGLEISRITSDPTAIESAARYRLGMVRPSEIVVPIKLSGGAAPNTISFGR